MFFLSGGLFWCVSFRWHSNLAGPARAECSFERSVPHEGNERSFPLGTRLWEKLDWGTRALGHDRLEASQCLDVLLSLSCSWRTLQALCSACQFQRNPRGLRLKSLLSRKQRDEIRVRRTSSTSEAVAGSERGRRGQRWGRINIHHSVGLLQLCRFHRELSSFS